MSELKWRYPQTLNTVIAKIRTKFPTDTCICQIVAVKQADSPSCEGILVIKPRTRLRPHAFLMRQKKSQINADHAFVKRCRLMVTQTLERLSASFVHIKFSKAQQQLGWKIGLLCLNR